MCIRNNDLFFFCDEQEQSRKNCVFLQLGAYFKVSVSHEIFECPVDQARLFIRSLFTKKITFLTLSIYLTSAPILYFCSNDLLTCVSCLCLCIICRAWPYQSQIDEHLQKWPAKKVYIGHSCFSTWPKYVSKIAATGMIYFLRWQK